jgi:beta-galactosidase
VGEERARHLASYAASAKLIFGPRAAYRTPTGRVHESGQPGPLRDLLGCSLLNFDGMRPGLTVHVGEHIVETWAESYRGLGDLAIRRYSDGPLIGEPAVVRHGNVTTIGAWSASLVAELLAEILGEAGIPAARLPEGVRVSRRGFGEIWMNFDQHPESLPDGSTIGPVSFQIRG